MSTLRLILAVTLLALAVAVAGWSRARPLFAALLAYADVGPRAIDPLTVDMQVVP